MSEAFDPAWLNAMTLSERRDRLNSHDDDFSDDPGVAEIRLRFWRTTASFEDDERLGHRLAASGLGLAEFKRILGTPVAALAGPKPPPWVEDIVRVEEGGTIAGSEGLFDPRAFPMSSPFQAQVAHYVDALVRFDQSVAPLRHLSPQSRRALLQGCVRGLLRRVENACRKTVVLELNVLRLNGGLAGPTSEARFDDFQNRMSAVGHRLAFQKKYAVLTRLLATQMANWLTFAKEILRRTYADWPAMAETFGFDEGDEIASLHAETGDAHCGGRSVCILDLKGGRRVVYKPRSLAPERGFADLLGWCGRNGLQISFRLPRILARESYGWMEHIDRVACEDGPDEAAFYLRLGAGLALLHALRATDIHYENILANGPNPVLIDLETLFHPDPKSDTTPVIASDAAQAAVRLSVLRTGVLPTPYAFGQDGDVFDSSAIGVQEGAPTPYRLHQVVNKGRDDIELGWSQARIGSALSLPGRVRRHRRYAGELIDGFSTTYRFIAEHCDALCAGRGPLKPFSRMRTRLVVRNTAAYASLLSDLTHPDYMRDGLAYEAGMDQLWNGVSRSPGAAAMVDAEAAQMRQGDIPLFTTATCDGAEVRSGDGQAIAFQLFETGFDSALSHIRNFSERRLADQVWIIRAALGVDQGYVAWSPSASASDAALGLALDVGHSIADRIVRFLDTASSLRAIPIGPEARLSQADVSVQVADIGLYQGNAGIALFLGYLGRRAEEPIFTALARALLADCLARVKADADGWNHESGLIGTPSLVYVLTHLASVLSDGTLLLEAEALAGIVLGRQSQMNQLDLLSGAAGRLLAMLPLANERGGAAMAVVRHCAQALVARSASGAPGWDALEIKRGLSHGLSGVALALTAFAQATGERFYLDEAIAVAACERDLLAGGRWTDTHKYKGEDQSSWCHGAAGIATSRLALYAAMPDRDIEDDIVRALHVARRRYWMDSHCLCHGVAGNLEPFLLAKRWEAFVPMTRDNHRLIRALHSDLRRRGWRALLPSQTLGLDLFTGLSGLGYALLRLDNPASTPSLLSLERPVSLTPHSFPPAL